MVGSNKGTKAGSKAGTKAGSKASLSFDLGFHPQMGGLITKFFLHGLFYISVLGNPRFYPVKQKLVSESSRQSSSTIPGNTKMQSQ